MRCNTFVTSRNQKQEGHNLYHIGGRQLEAKNKGLGMFKIPAFLLATTLLASSSVSVAHANNNLMFEEGVAGIAAILDKYHEEVSGNDENNGSIIDILEEEIISPYVNLGVQKLMTM